MTDRKAVVKNADMSEDMQQDAVDCATTAIDKFNIEKALRHSLVLRGEEMQLKEVQVGLPTVIGYCCLHKERI